MAWITLRNGPVINSALVMSVEVRDVTLFFQLSDGSVTPDVYESAADANAAFTNISAIIGANGITPGAPAILALYPTGGTTAGGTILAVAGINFNAGFDFTIGGTSGSHQQVNPTTIWFTTPAKAAGTYDVEYLGVDGQTATLHNGYTYS